MITGESLCDEQTWRFWMGEMPMPPETTRNQMRAMLEVVNKMEHKDYAVEQLAWYEGLWKQYKPKYDLALKHKDSHDDYKKEYKTQAEIMKLIKQGIVFWREELTE